VISGLVGLRPRPDDILEVHPLVPETWDYFCLDHLLYHGRWLTIVWDKTGSHYGRGQGMHILVDGKEVGTAQALGPLTARLPALAAVEVR
jgi:hypothetical protein